MVTIAAVLAAAALTFRFWLRVDEMSADIAALRVRIETLEQPRVRRRRRAAPAPRTAAPSPPLTDALPPIAPAASLPRSTAAADERASDHMALETRIGSRWLLYVGVVAIVIGVSYFEKLAIENHWISATARVLQGAVAGTLMIAAGVRFVRKGYALYGQILSGCGVAILYVSTYAAFTFYHLIDQPVAFALMVAVTAIAADLADRQRSQGLALVAVGGGFATPFLLPASADAEAALFGYDTILIAGTMFLARRRDWPALNVVSYGFTVVTFLSWCAAFYTPAKYLPTEVFLTIFCAMFLAILRRARRSSQPSARAERAILWTAPAGYYLASIAILFDHSIALLVYVIVFSLAGVIVSARTGSVWRLAFWMAAAFPLLLWSDLHGVRSCVAGGLATWMAVYVLNLAGLFEATLYKSRRFAAADTVLLHLNGLGCYVGACLLIDPLYPHASAALAAALALGHGIAAVPLARRFRDEALHVGALAFTLLAIAIARQFDGAAFIAAAAAEGTAIIWLGLRERREWLRAGGVVLFAVATVNLIDLLFSEPPIGQLLLINRRALCGAFVVALTYALTFAHQRADGTSRRRVEVGVGLLIATLLLLAVASSEIVAYWLLHAAPPFEPASQVIVASLATGAAIVWLGLRRRQEWLRACGGAVVALAVFSLLSIQLQAVPPGYVAVLNGRAAAGLLAILGLGALADIHRRRGEHLGDLATNLAVLTTTASLLTLSLLTSEIDAFWTARGAAAAWSMAREGLHAMAWAGVGAFLIWQGVLKQRASVRAIGGALVGVGVVRLLRVQFGADALPSAMIANARVLSSVTIIAILYGLASVYRRAGRVGEQRISPAALLSLAANALTLTMLTSEITAYWHVQDARQGSAFPPAESHLAREMMLSITWAIYATLLVVVGLRRRYAPIRYFAIAVFVVTIVKVFTIDLAELDRLYRVLSVVGLGVTLLLTSYLYQRFTPETRSA